METETGRAPGGAEHQPGERALREIELPGGELVLARVTVLDAEDLPEGPDLREGPEDDFGFADVGALDRLAARVDRLGEVISGVGSAVVDAAASARPDEVSATFGVELVAKSGRAVAMLADGEAKASISVTLRWVPGGTRLPPADDRADPADPAAPPAPRGSGGPEGGN
ncbi:hypothetical protein E0L36_11745 [Streptomyces sp. AJS327]|uniref:CU044_2847 family protein n=1 Tax=Streptomyces sp. AJS327 TaxID=2545265 RepID=UPI0015DF68AD|nr:CU044_2847 family protein [Streptomyces sp. AJS327]MBA0051541.1 hypothetical protein [Streptomyces sp. AJS327]